MARGDRDARTNLPGPSEGRARHLSADIFDIGGRPINQSDLDWIWNDDQPFPRTPFDDDVVPPSRAVAIIGTLAVLAWIVVVSAVLVWFLP